MCPDKSNLCVIASTLLKLQAFKVCEGLKNTSCVNRVQLYIVEKTVIFFKKLLFILFGNNFGKLEEHLSERWKLVISFNNNGLKRVWIKRVWMRCGNLSNWLNFWRFFSYQLQFQPISSTISKFSGLNSQLTVQKCVMSQLTVKILSNSQPSRPSKSEICFKSNLCW